MTTVKNTSEACPLKGVRPQANPLRRLPPAPAYGAHSREIATELGYTPAQIEQLSKDRVISERWRDVSTYLPT